MTVERGRGWRRERGLTVDGGGLKGEVEGGWRREDGDSICRRGN